MGKRGFHIGQRAGGAGPPKDLMTGQMPGRAGQLAAHELAALWLGAIILQRHNLASAASRPLCCSLDRAPGAVLPSCSLVGRLVGDGRLACAMRPPKAAPLWQRHCDDCLALSATTCACSTESAIARLGPEFGGAACP